jgi:hypothetical protein
MSHDAFPGPGSRGRSPQVSPAKSPGPSTLSPGTLDVSKSPMKSPGKSPMKSPAKHDANKIELKKDPNGLGICIVGGSDTPIVRQQSLFYVCSINLQVLL